MCRASKGTGQYSWVLLYSRLVFLRRFLARRRDFGLAQGPRGRGRISVLGQRLSGSGPRPGLPPPVAEPGWVVGAACGPPGNRFPGTEDPRTEIRPRPRDPKPVGPFAPSRRCWRCARLTSILTKCKADLTGPRTNRSVPPRRAGEDGSCRSSSQLEKSSTPPATRAAPHLARTLGPRLRRNPAAGCLQRGSRSSMFCGAPPLASVEHTRRG